MKIVIFNDTSKVESNPGCYHTVKELKNNLQQKNPDSEIITFPLFFGYEKYRKLSKKNWNTKNRIRRYYLSIIWRLKSEALYNKLIKSKIRKEDKIVINAEGTIHHNSIGALTLLGITYILSKKGFKVFVLNGTIDSITPILLKKAFQKCHLIVPREPISLRYLQKHKIHNVKQGADCVFHIKPIKLTPPNLNISKILFTPGVLAAHGNIEHKKEIKTIYIQLNEIIKKHKHVTILQIEEKEKEFLEYAKKKGCDIIKVNDYTNESILEIIDKFDIIISARYHILIFAVLLQKGIVPLDITNTYKIKGLLELLNIKNIPKNFTPLFPTKDSISKCIELSNYQTI